AMHDSRDDAGTADVPPILVETEGRRTEVLFGERAVIACPIVRVERRVPEILHQVAMKTAGSALGHKADLAARRPAVLGGVVCSQDLDLLNAIDVLRAKHRTGGARSSRDGAVHHDDILVGAAAVDAEAAV